jgi:hypothetical protein
MEYSKSGPLLKHGDSQFSFYDDIKAKKGMKYF